jgi:CcmD family protein
MKKYSAILTFLFFSLLSNAQNDGGDFMRNTGSIYVVVGVILIIFIGIIAFLINLDKKITKLEKEE